jgi:hypothetical protein
MVSEIDNETKCFNCGKDASIQLIVEPEGGSLYLCEDRDCKEEALIQLDDVDFGCQEESHQQIRYTDTVGAISVIIIIAIWLGVLIYRFINL